MASRARFRQYRWVALFALMGGLSCSTNKAGLGGDGDSGVAGSSGIPYCFAGTIDRANWPVAATSASCIKPCGPDDLGLRSCSQSDLGTCQAMSGCVCLSTPCVTCAACAFLSSLPDCYVQSNAASAPTCAASVENGGPCSPACGKSLCLHADGKTGCVCNAKGKYACADWNGTTWN